MSKYKWIVILAALLLIPIVTIQAQATFAPDRPGLGDGAYVIQTDAAYLEIGGEYFDGGAIDQFSLGQVMFRYGMFQNIELRLSLNSFVVETHPVNNETGLADPGLGLKFELYHNPESSFTLSGLTSITIPLGYSSFSDNSWSPSAALLADYQLSKIWSINANLGYTLNSDPIPDQFMFTFTPGFAIGQSAYGAYFGYAAFLTSVVDQHFIEAGITRIVGDDIQLDINGGVDVNRGNIFVGAGFAKRF